MSQLKCNECGSDLYLSVGFTGCDRDTEAGKDSGYNWAISLICKNDKCARVYIIGYVKEYSDFSRLKDGLKCVD